MKRLLPVVELRRRIRQPWPSERGLFVWTVSPGFSWAWLEAWAPMWTIAGNDLRGGRA